MSSDTVAKSDTSAEKPVPLFAIFSVFFRLGAFSFGGGVPGWVYREVVQLRPWLEEKDFMSGLALSQIMPGANVSNIAVYVGLRLRGIAGASSALVGLLTPPFFAVILLVSLYDQVSDLTWLEVAMNGVTAAALGLLLLLGGRSAWNARGSIQATVAMVATFILVGVLQWPLLLVVFGVGSLSVAAAWPRKKRDAQ